MREISDEEFYSTLNKFLSANGQPSWQKVERVDGVDEWVQCDEANH